MNAPAKCRGSRKEIIRALQVELCDVWQAGIPTLVMPIISLTGALQVKLLVVAAGL